MSIPAAPYERPELGDEDRLNVFQKIGIVLLAAMLLYALTGSSPFSRGVDLEATENAANQVFWLVAFVIALYVIQSDLRRSLLIFSRNWALLLVLAWCLASILWSDHPDITLRRSVKLAIMYVVTLGTAVACTRLDRLLHVMVLVTGLVMLVNVASMPLGDLGRISEGNFVGMHPGKNVAGQVALIAILVWLYYAKSLRTTTGKLFAYGAVALFYVFLLGTVSKTAIALAVLIPLATAVLNYFGRSGPLVRLNLYLVAVATLLLLVAAAGVAGITLDDVIGLFVSDLTFTGRDDIWRFTYDVGANHPWTGIGYGALWYVGDRASPLDWAPALYPEAYFLPAAGSAHNGYLDLFAQVGAVGVVLAAFAVLRSLFVARYLRDDVVEGAVPCAAMDAIFAILFSLVLLNITESQYFNANHKATPWFFALMLQVDRELAFFRARRARAATAPADMPGREAPSRL